MKKETPLFASQMTLRDHFASHAMQALLQASYTERNENYTTDDLVEQAYWIADQMIFAREQKG